MVVVPFGFSIGDFISGTKLLIDVLSAFKEANGASSKYASETVFLHSLTSTLQHLEDYVKPNPQSALSSSISKLLDTVRGPLDDFKDFLDRYEASLGKASTKSKLGKVPKTVTYTLKDISGKIEKLRRQAEQPLQAINSLLSLQQIKSIEEMPDQPWRPEQCAQIVEAIKVADIPTELDKQIQVLQRSASEHNIRQDEQLQRVKEMRSKLEDGLASLALSLEKVKDATTIDVATKSGQQVQLDASKDLQSGILQLSAALETGKKEITESMEVQKDLILVIKTFLEEKAAIQERAMAEAEVSIDSSNEKIESSAWPSATLTAAHLASTLLSTIVSSVTAVLVVRQSQNAQKPMPMPPSRVPDVPRTVNSATSNSTVSKTKNPSELSSPSRVPDIPRTVNSATSNSTVSKTKTLSKLSSPSRASTWVSDFSSLTGYGQTLSTPKLIRNDLASTHVPFKGYSGDTGDTSTETSKLKDSDSDSRGRKTKERPHRYPDSTSINTDWSKKIYPDSTSLNTGWSKKISKLDDSDPDPRGRKNERLHHYPDSAYLDSPGPILPPSNNGLHAGSDHGRHPRSHDEGYNSGYSRGHSGEYYGGYIGGVVSDHGRHSRSHNEGHNSGYSGGYSGGHSEEYYGGYIRGSSGGASHSGNYTGGDIRGVGSGGHSGDHNTTGLLHPAYVSPEIVALAARLGITLEEAQALTTAGAVAF